MRTLILVAALSMAANAVAAPQAAGVGGWIAPDVAYAATAASQTTRADVIAELVAAQSQGLTQQQGEITVVPPTAHTSSRNTAVVRGAAIQAESTAQFGTVYGPRYRN